MGELRKQLEAALYLLGLNPYDDDLLSDVENIEETIKNYPKTESE